MKMKATIAFSLVGVIAAAATIVFSLFDEGDVNPLVIVLELLVIICLVVIAAGAYQNSSSSRSSQDKEE